MDRPVYKCPPWNDHDEHNSKACFLGLESIIKRACAAARLQVPNSVDIADWHGEAFREFVPLAYYAGCYRQEDPERVCLGTPIGIANVPGTHCGLVVAEMQNLTGFMGAELRSLDVQWKAIGPETRIQSLAKIIGVSVGAFIKIHPFINGNGRMSRLLWGVLLSRMGLPMQVSVLRRPSEPYGHVMSRAMVGDFAPAVAMVYMALAKGQRPAVTLS